MLNRRKLLLAAPAVLTFPRLAEAICTSTGLGPVLTAPGSLPTLATLNNPFLLNSGTAITTKVQWQQRRAELKQLVQYYLIGHAPPPVPVTVVGTPTTNTLTNSNTGGTMTHMAVTLQCACPGGTFQFFMNFYIPTVGAPRFPGPYPTLMGAEMSWSPIADNGSGSEDASIGVNAVQALVARGFVICEFTRDPFSQDPQDTPNNVDVIFTQPAYTLFPFDINGVTGYDWGMYRAHAWGYSRAIDYLMTLTTIVDPLKICVEGHSRSAVSSTIAGAFDERIAIVCGNQSGIIPYRYGDASPAGPQYAANLTEQFNAYNPGVGHDTWFNLRTQQFIPNTATAAGSSNLNSGPIEKLPFDWHQIVGMIAPRGFINNNALTAYGLAPVASTQAFLAAQQIWVALGAGTRTTGMFYSNVNSYNSTFPGELGHELSNIYWTSFVNWMDFVFFNTPLPPDGTGATPSHSYIIPYTGLTQLYSWLTPTLT